LSSKEAELMFMTRVLQTLNIWRL